MADARTGHRPSPEDVRRSGETLGAPGEEPVPRQAASVVLLRGGAHALELLLVQRTHAARFMAGVWVFPGGAVDPGEGEGEAAHRQAAVRELEEEAAIGGVRPDGLVRFSRWITPPEIRIRFDTHFFLAVAPEGAEPAVDGDECIDVGWFSPAAALEAHARGALALVFPTVRHLEQFGAFATADALLAHARGREVVPVQPRLVVEGEVARIVLPGEPGYEEEG